MCLSFQVPISEHHLVELMHVTTPLDVGAWERALATHPDVVYARYICQGLRAGFRIGYCNKGTLRSATSNMESTRLHPEVVTEYLTKELGKGRMLGPFPPSWDPYLHVNRVGLVPKGHNTGKFRLITDLSFPVGYSINDGIQSELCSLSYTSVDDVASIVYRLGRGSLLAKVDVESAYRLIPVHPQDRILQAIQWEGSLYVDPMLPFGLRSAPKIFNAVADALNWYMIQLGIRNVLHYLDDFIVIGPPNSPECGSALALLERTCEELKVPLASHKREGPTTGLTFLGITIDTVAGEMRLPPEKLQRVKEMLRQWGDRRACSRRELESLIGLLNHACKVVRPGRSFLRRMIDLLHSRNTRPGGNSFIRLNTSCRADIAWWGEFVESWNGVSFLDPPLTLDEVVMTSDASGSWGCGAWHDKAWFQVQWDSRAENLSIACKELIPIVLGCAAWGDSWQGRRVTCRCDNQVVVAGLRSRSSRDKGVMHLLRCLVFVEACLNCYLVPEYIDTHSNHLADDLSRDNVLSFFLKVPDADQRATQVSQKLLDLLLHPQADWISEQWRQQYKDIFRKA